MRLFNFYTILFILVMSGIGYVIFNKINEDPKIAVVLSVGGAKGVAHMGAIKAIEDSGINPDYIFGNSMGAVIGSIYAVDPNSTSLLQNYRWIMNNYFEKTKESKKDRGLLGALVGFGTIYLSGGTLGWETIIASGTIGAINMELIDDFSNDRFRESLLEFYSQHGDVEGIDNTYFMPLTKIPFATAYSYQKGHGVEYETLKVGSLSEAVALSARNPFIFSDVSIHDKRGIDPGADRISAIPIQEAWDTFKPDKIIVINVTGEKPYFTNEVKAEIVTVDLIINNNNQEQLMLANGEDFDSAYQYAYQNTLASLKTFNFWNRDWWTNQ